MRDIQERRHQWIARWIREKGSASVINQDFHEEYFKIFGGAVIFKNWGAQPVKKAMADLKRMYSMGMLNRVRISTKGGWYPGFPNWVWAYIINSNMPYMKNYGKQTIFQTQQQGGNHAEL